MGKFQNYMIEEGLFGCIEHGVKEGWKSFAKKRAEEKRKDEKGEMSKKILAAEGDQLKKLIRQMVDRNFTIDKEGKVQDAEKQRNQAIQATTWAQGACTIIKMGLVFVKCIREICIFY